MLLDPIYVIACCFSSTIQLAEFSLSPRNAANMKRTLASFHRVPAIHRFSFPCDFKRASSVSCLGDWEINWKIRKDFNAFEWPSSVKPIQVERLLKGSVSFNEKSKRQLIRSWKKLLEKTLELKHLFIDGNSSSGIFGACSSAFDDVSCLFFCTHFPT